MFQLFSIKQANAQLSEARQTARQTEETARQTEEAARQSRAIVVFTVFTVVFLPLSLVTSIFGMNVRTNTPILLSLNLLH